MIMLQTEIFDKNVEAYGKWYEENPEVYQSEITQNKMYSIKGTNNSPYNCLCNIDIIGIVFHLLTNYKITI